MKSEAAKIDFALKSDCPADALDRLRFEALTRPELIGSAEKLEIRLEVDREAGYAMLAEGSELPSPVRFNRLLADMMTRTL